MEAVYNILEVILPFNFIKYEFMKNDIIAILLISPIFAILRNYGSK
jgi:zinc transport system permease protein